MKSSLNNPGERVKGTGSESGGAVTIDADDCVISVDVSSVPMLFTLTNNKISVNSIIQLSINTLGSPKLIATLRDNPGEGSVALSVDTDNDTMGGAFSGGTYKINVSVF